VNSLFFSPFSLGLVADPCLFHLSFLRMKSLQNPQCDYFPPFWLSFCPVCVVFQTILGAVRSILKVPVVGMVLIPLLKSLRCNSLERWYAFMRRLFFPTTLEASASPRNSNLIFYFFQRKRFQRIALTFFQFFFFLWFSPCRNPTRSRFFFLFVGGVLCFVFFFFFFFVSFFSGFSKAITFPEIGWSFIRHTCFEKFFVPGFLVPPPQPWQPGFFFFLPLLNAFGKCWSTPAFYVIRSFFPGRALG